MSEPQRNVEPLFDLETFQAIVAIIKRTHEGLLNACLLQSDQDEKAKNIEWYRGGAQCLLGLKGEIEFEEQRRRQARVETPEESIERNLGILEKARVNWQLAPEPDKDDEL